MKYNKINLVLIALFFFILLLIFKINTGNMLIDFSREVYIPYKMLNGGVLYKDIFVIYGIFGYIINYLIYKISLNFNNLIFSSVVISFYCVYFYYLILKKIIKNNTAILILTFGFISLSIFSDSTFSFIIPYSYSNLFSILGAYMTIYFALNNKVKQTYLSLGLILANRIEFFIPFFIISTLYFINKKEKIKFNFLYIFIPSILNIVYIIYNRVSIYDLKNNFLILKKMASTDTIAYFYKSMGSFFELKNFIYNLIVISLLSLIVFAFKKFHKISIAKYALYIIFTLFLILTNPNETLNLISIPLVIYSILNIKKLRKKEVLLLLFAIFLCCKSIFKTGTISYSNFGFFFLILYLYIVLKKFFKNTNSNLSVILISIYIFTANCFNIYYFIKNPKYNIKTQTGTISLKDYEQDLFIQISDFFKQNLKKNETFIVVPEGEIFNLIFDKPHNFYNSTFTPLDFETFKENEMINSLKEKAPNYIIFFPRNTADYGKPVICYNYGIDFCSFIMDNYRRRKILNGKYKGLIFEKIKD